MRSILNIIVGSDPDIVDLTTIESVSADLGLSALDSGDLDVIETQITRYSKMISEMTGRVFSSQTVLETFWVDYSPLKLPLFLKRYPVTDVELVEVDSSAIDASLYHIDSERGLIWFENDMRSASKIAVRYSGGYVLPDEAPAALEQAVIEMIREQRRRAAATNSDGTSVSSVRATVHGDTRVEYGTSSSSSQSSTSGPVPQSVLNLIEPFRAQAV